MWGCPGRCNGRARRFRPASSKPRCPVGSDFVEKSHCCERLGQSQRSKDAFTFAGRRGSGRPGCTGNAIRHSRYMLRSTEAAEPEDALEVGEQHFDAFPVAARLLKGLGLAKGSGDIAGVLVDTARDLARWLLGTAPQFERAHIAIAFTCPIQ